jgi:hypothetical protein
MSRSSKSEAGAVDYYDLWRILGAYRDRLDLSDFGTLLREKCAVRNVAYDGPEDFFEERTLACVERTWDPWLGPLVPGLPSLQTMIDALRPQLAMRRAVAGGSAEGVGGFFAARPAVVDRLAAELRRRLGRVARRCPALITATRLGIEKAEREADRRLTALPASACLGTLQVGPPITSPLLTTFGLAKPVSGQWDASQAAAWDARFGSDITLSHRGPLPSSGRNPGFPIRPVTRCVLDSGWKGSLTAAEL